MADKPSILFLGTPEFAVPSLRKLIESGFPVTGVVTVPDRPAGRGLKLRPSPVKKIALATGLRLFQPADLKDPAFIREIHSLRPDIGIVIAFRMLPRQLWSLPSMGTFNLHASLLPRYRGAAPINWSIINGEKVTGLTTFLLDDHMDTGRLLCQKRVVIGDDETAGELHDRMMLMGADLVCETLERMVRGEINSVDQGSVCHSGETLCKAPKLFREDCRINWHDDVGSIQNRIRGLSPYPGAYTEITLNDGIPRILKIYRAEAEEITPEVPAGTVLTDGKNFLKFAARNGHINLNYIQLAGRKPMYIGEFLKGYGFHFV